MPLLKAKLLAEQWLKSDDLSVPDYISFLKELFTEFGEVEFRRMFGSHGVFHQGLMFALVADDVLYFKVDKTLLNDYEKKGLAPFAYIKQNKVVNLSYYQAPEEVLEDPDELVFWASKSYHVALQQNLK